jgi:hypothetical protein
MEIGDGVFVPKRNILKLQAAAEYSSTKSGPPALPGTISPLRLTHIIPLEKRAPLAIELGKPWKPSMYTALNASRWMRDFSIKIDEPVLSDSDDSSEEDDSKVESFEAEVEDPQIRENHGVVLDCKKMVDPTSKLSSDTEVQSASQIHQSTAGAGRFVDKDGGTSQNLFRHGENLSDIRSVNPCVTCAQREGQNVSTERIDETARIRESASQLAALMNLLNDSELHNCELKHLLSSAENRIAELQARLHVNSADHVEDGDGESIRTHNPIATHELEASEREWLVHLKDQNQSLIERDSRLSQQLRTATEAKEASEAELLKLQREVITDISIRLENERLLKVILDLKNELDHEPGSPDVVNQLKEAKYEVASLRAELETLRNEMAKAKSREGEGRVKHGGNLFSKISGSNSKQRS